MELTNNFYVLSFAEAKQPEYREKRGQGYIEFGEKNDYPTYLLDLYSKSAKHQSIVRGKVNYIIGNGWATKESDPAAEAFIKSVNSFGESLNDLTRKVDIDIEIFGGAYLELIWSQYGGQLVDVNHIDYTKIRSNKDNTEFWYKQDWKIIRSEAEVIPAFTKFKINFLPSDPVNLFSNLLSMFPFSSLLGSPLGSVISLLAENPVCALPSTCLDTSISDSI